VCGSLVLQAWQWVGLSIFSLAFLAYQIKNHIIESKKWTALVRASMGIRLTQDGYLASDQHSFPHITEDI